MPDKVNIQDWFDVSNVDHLRAYQHLYQTGSWPEGFIPAHVKTAISGWQFMLADKLAMAYVDTMLIYDKLGKQLGN